METLFDNLKYINMKVLSSISGIKYSMLRQYAIGNKHPSPKREEQILQSFYKIGEDIINHVKKIKMAKIAHYHNGFRLEIKNESTWGNMSVTYSIEIEAIVNGSAVKAYSSLVKMPTSNKWYIMDLTFEHSHSLSVIMDFSTQLWNFPDSVFEELEKDYLKHLKFSDNE